MIRIGVAPLEDYRKWFADELRQYADKIEMGDKQPSAVFAQCFYSDDIILFDRRAGGYRTLEASGLFQRLSIECATMNPKEKL